MLNQFSRTELIYGKEGISKLIASNVAIFGIGGVGGYAVEALVRSGIGRLDLFDDDKICLTNINRQIYATRKTIGMYKVDAAKERAVEINPDVVVNTFKVFYLPRTSAQIDLSIYDYVIDAIDTVSGKIELAVKAHEYGVSIISSMGAGNKINASEFEVADIYDTSVCPLAKVMRQELRKRGIPKLKVVYSKEPAILPIEDMQTDCKVNCICPPGVERNYTQRRQVPGSNAFVPATVGLLIACEVVNDITGIRAAPHV